MLQHRPRGYFRTVSAAIAMAIAGMTATGCGDAESPATPPPQAGTPGLGSTIISALVTGVGEETGERAAGWLLGKIFHASRTSSTAAQYQSDYNQIESQLAQVNAQLAQLNGQLADMSAQLSAIECGEVVNAVDLVASINAISQAYQGGVSSSYEYFVALAAKGALSTSAQEQLVNWASNAVLDVNSTQPGAVAHQIETIAQGYKAMAAACIPAWWKTWSSGQKSNQIDPGPFWQGVIPVLTAAQSAQTLGIFLMVEALDVLAYEQWVAAGGNPTGVAVNDVPQTVCPPEKSSGVPAGCGNAVTTVQALIGSLFDQITSQGADFTQVGLWVPSAQTGDWYGLATNAANLLSADFLQCETVNGNWSVLAPGEGAYPWMNGSGVNADMALCTPGGITLNDTWKATRGAPSAFWNHVGSGIANSGAKNLYDYLDSVGVTSYGSFKGWSPGGACSPAGVNIVGFRTSPWNTQVEYPYTVGFDYISGAASVGSCLAALAHNANPTIFPYPTVDLSRSACTARPGAGSVPGWQLGGTGGQVATPCGEDLRHLAGELIGGIPPLAPPAPPLAPVYPTLSISFEQELTSGVQPGRYVLGGNVSCVVPLEPSPVAFPTLDNAGAAIDVYGGQNAAVFLGWKFDGFTEWWGVSRWGNEELLNTPGEPNGVNLSAAYMRVHGQFPGVGAKMTVQCQAQAQYNLPGMPMVYMGYSPAVSFTFAEISTGYGLAWVRND